MHIWPNLFIYLFLTTNSLFLTTQQFFFHPQNSNKKKRNEWKEFLSRAPLGDTLQYKKFVCSLISWTLVKRNVCKHKFLWHCFGACPYSFLCKGPIRQKWPECVLFGAQKNGSNDFPETLPSPYFGCGLPIDDIHIHRKIHYDVIIWGQKWGKIFLDVAQGRQYT